MGERFHARIENLCPKLEEYHEGFDRSANRTMDLGLLEGKGGCHIGLDLLYLSYHCYLGLGTLHLGGIMTVVQARLLIPPLGIAIGFFIMALTITGSAIMELKYRLSGVSAGIFILGLALTIALEIYLIANYTLLVHVLSAPKKQLIPGNWKGEE
jgi:hypothetical protein